MESANSDFGKTLLTVDENLDFIKNFFGEGIDLIESRYEIFENHIRIGLAYIDTISDKDLIMQHVVMPVLKCNNSLCQNADSALLLIKSSVISATDIQQTSEMTQVIGRILNGDTVLFIEKANEALIVGTRKVEKRTVEAPENESTVLGSQESFTDDVKINCSLILKRLPVPNLRFEEFSLGTLSHTKVKLIWLEGIANAEVINEARSRLQRVDIDNVDGIGVIGELIEDKPLSLFPKYRQTERPDVAARNLTDGHFIIICSNSPFAFIAPDRFWDNFKSMDDYEERSLTSSYLRIIRYVAFAFSILISSLYLSFVTYNQTIVPSKLALNIAQEEKACLFLPLLNCSF